MKWILIIALYQGGLFGALDSPTYYDTAEECQEAGKAVRKDIGRQLEWSCIQGYVKE